MQYRDIDWNRMWQEARRQKSWKKKQSNDWDKRAATFAERNVGSPFADLFLARLRLEPGWRVLDVGCGPGTLALPLARAGHPVTGLDYSAAMLAELDRLAAGEGLASIRTIQAAWTDDWQALGIAPHEVAIASRSLSVDDLAAALAKLNDWASRAVYIADRVGAGPFDPDLFAAIGRDFDPGPDYIFTLNLLYAMGIHARVDFITLDENRTYGSRKEALQSSRWMVDDLTPTEDGRLADYVDQRLSQGDDGLWRLARRTQPRWALIWWEKDRTGA
ncbi:MAG: class I SAM-dependent methyltransferase [Thermodesulfobacteriota bacterium]